MARGGFLAALQRASRAAARDRERAQREAYRRHAASKRAAEQARRKAEQAERAAERDAAQRSRARAARLKQAEKDAREAHLAAREAEVEERSNALAQVYDEIDSLLACTFAIDDYVELDALRSTASHPPFDRSDLEVPIPPARAFVEPPRPTLKLPLPPSGLMKFFGKKRHERAVQDATAAHANTTAAWESACKLGKIQQREAVAAHGQAESRRSSELAAERARYAKECEAREQETAEQNRQLDELIANLGYGVPEAIQEYVSIVLANSCYPDHFKVTHEFSFDAATAELRLRVTIPPPGEVPAIKGYKYVKASDEVVEVPLSQKEARERYASAVHQVALRTFHEVFESDRRGLISTISLETGTETVDPATGRRGFIPLVIAAAERERFLQIDLSGVVPASTLAHLGAAVSKNPYGLVGVEKAGARRA